jgi:S1-C subfamily serine protease
MIISRSSPLLLASLLLAGCSHSPAPESLHDRYMRLFPAVVVIQSGTEAGTGCFVDADGSLVTAAHVVFNNTLDTGGTGDLKPKPDLKMAGAFMGVLPLQIDSVSADDRRYANYGLALIKTHRTTSAFIPLADPKTQLAVGEHLISIGYPVSGLLAPVLYDGFMSALYASPNEQGVIRGPKLTPTYPMFRVQMPITGGASGSPLIDDFGHVVGVINQEPIVYPEDISKAIAFYKSDKQAAYPDVDVSEMVLKLLGEMADSNDGYFSSGSGLAVAVSVLVAPHQSPATATVTVP